jgi:alginate O-acetyltransferase complex protein AlgI
MPMLFNSYIFLFFLLPLALFGWWGLRHHPQPRLLSLVVASYVFYGWWDWRFTALLSFSTLVDFAVGSAMERTTIPSRRKFFLLISVVVNLGLLGFFKYVGFFADSVNALTTWLHSGGQIPVWQIVLPVGISFYTFQTLSYSVDVYRGQVKSAKSILHFAAYVSMFPQLVAGPIVRYSEVEQALNLLATCPDWSKMRRGIYFFVVGLSQKLLIADWLAKGVNPLLEAPEELTLISGWLAALAYSCQLYFDFSGYSNMAVGLGCLLGFSFPKNFDSPYKSRNIVEFWRSWHITLSAFLKEYLYIPLGGNRCTPWMNARNLILVMFLGGLWHGAGWTFVWWGLYHGGLLVLYSVSRKWTKFRFPIPWAVASTFLAVVLGWVLFRSSSMEMAGSWYLAMSGWKGVGLGQLASCRPLIIPIVAAMGIVWLAPNLWQIRWPENLGSAIALGMLLVICILRFDIESPFLYFQF